MAGENNGAGERELYPEFGKAIKEIKKRKAKKVAVQIPEGLITKAKDIIGEIEQGTGASVILFAEPCYGACDLKDREAKQLGATLLVHFGHTKLIKSGLPTIYLPVHYGVKEAKLEKFGKSILEKMREKKYGKVAISGTVQYIGFMDGVSKILDAGKIKVFVGKGNKAVSFPGQLLGCNYSAIDDVENKVDAIIFIGDGVFHPIGISYHTDKPVVIANPVSGNVRMLRKEKDLFLRQRFAVIESARDAKLFGIVVSTKKGQERQGEAMELKKKIEKGGKGAIILAADNLFPENLNYFGVDCFVNTACPRIASDDVSRFKVPVLNPKELEILLGERKFEEYEFFNFRD